tara:strand:- start:1325 stop:1741 length:417 start_codon:yes stop_codon:yes gene_type:complete
MSNCVYKIETPNGLYVGSCKSLKKRKQSHKNFINKKDYKIYRNNIDFSKYVFSVLEENIEDALELRKREQHFIDELQPPLNSRAAHSTRTHKEYMKEYLTRRFNCECGAKPLTQNRARHFRSKKHKTKIEAKNKIVVV